MSDFIYKKDFSSKYFEIFKEILIKTTEEGTPYDLTKKFVNEQAKDIGLKPKDKFELITTLMTNITINITSQAMQTARVITLQNFRHEANMEILKDSVDKSNIEIEILKDTKNYKKDIQQEQLNKLKKEIEYLQKQIEELPKATKNNNEIQALRASSQMIATIVASDAVPTTDMITQIYTIIKNLAQVDKPGSIKIDKK